MDDEEQLYDDFGNYIGPETSLPMATSETQPFLEDMYDEAGEKSHQQSDAQTPVNDDDDDPTMTSRLIAQEASIRLDMLGTKFRRPRDHGIGFVAPRAHEYFYVDRTLCTAV